MEENQQSTLPFPKLFSSEEVDNFAYVQPTPTPEGSNPLDVVREYHPQIYKKVALMWGTVEAYNYLNDLILDDRHFEHGMQRQGFSVEVLNALLTLFLMHSQFASVTHHVPVVDTWHNCK